MTPILNILSEIIAFGIQLVILGPVNANEQADLEHAIRKYQNDVLWLRQPTAEISQNALAACDVALFPSSISVDASTFCSALQNGTIPLAAACSGIHFLAPDIQCAPDTGLAFYFYKRTSEALVDCIRNMKNAYQDESFWNAVTERCKNVDFSWKKTAEEYEQLYHSLLARSGTRPTDQASPSGLELRWAAAL